jgi:hypothetical protein
MSLLSGVVATVFSQIFAAMATDVLSIPLRSTECEHIFSEAGYLVSGRQGKLQEDII